MSPCDNFCSSLKFSDSRRTLAEWSKPWKKGLSNLRKHYLSKARVPFCTAMTAARTVLKSFDSVTSSKSQTTTVSLSLFKRPIDTIRDLRMCPTRMAAGIPPLEIGHFYVHLWPQWYHRVHFLLVGIMKTLRPVL